MEVALDRTFEAFVFDWDGTAVADRSEDGAAVRERVEALVEAGADVFVVSGTHVDNIDGQLFARPHPSGAGHLFLCLNRGSEVFLVGEAGPTLVWRREASPHEDAALDQAAELTIKQLRKDGMDCEVVSSRLNRRKIDLIPDPAWADPPKAQIEELLTSVEARLQSHGVEGLAVVVALAEEAGIEAGLGDARVSTDAKHVEIGLTDKSDSMRWALSSINDRGVGPGQMLIIGDEFGSLGGVKGSDALMLIPEVSRAIACSVGPEPEGVPAGVVHLGGGPPRFLALLDDQLRRRQEARVPSVDEDPDWTIVIADGSDRIMRRVHESLLSLGDGKFGTRVTVPGAGASSPMLLAGNVYYDRGDHRALLPGPRWDAIEWSGEILQAKWVLDMRTGVLTFEADLGEGLLRALWFSSLARPGSMALRAEAPLGILQPGPIFTQPTETVPGLPGDGERQSWEYAEQHGVASARAGSSSGGGITAVGTDRATLGEGCSTIERLATFVSDPAETPSVVQLMPRLTALRSVGFESMLAEHRSTWVRRWRDADVVIKGDPEAQLAARFAMFHLMANVGDQDDSGVGARGLTGSAYAGHVFWDADVFMLPMLAATHPSAARAMLEYRIRRLPAARGIAAQQGHHGARFPWESADLGEDVTPRVVRDLSGRNVLILTGAHEEHIVADVAWAAWHYAEWTGDEAFLDGPGRALIVETAKYWASRVRYDAAGQAHIYGVIGPDEYHAPVDDNVFTNVMARWNLQRGADLLERLPRGEDLAQVDSWRTIAEALVDGFDPTTLLYEQFAGFYDLEPLFIAEHAEPPVAADVLLGSERVTASQVIKQPDVLMLHHLVPEAVAPGSLHANLAFYGPRTAHGSSLSPPVQAALLARAGRSDDALAMFQIACRLDLDDLTGTTAGGLHLATMGGVWQALTFGFLGLRPTKRGLLLDPKLPSTWETLELSVCFHGTRVRVRAGQDGVEVAPDAVVSIELPGCPPTIVDVSGARFCRNGEGWRRVP